MVDVKEKAFQMRMDIVFKFNPRFKVLRTQVPWNSIKSPSTCIICNLLANTSQEDLHFCTEEHLIRYQRSLTSTRVKGKYPPQDIAWKPMEIVSEEEPDDLEINLDSLDVAGDTRVESDESTAGEKYSKAVGDRAFQKFVKRLERSPEQILRYVSCV
jgi:hypothetical protein